MNNIFDRISRGTYRDDSVNIPITDRLAPVNRWEALIEKSYTLLYPEKKFLFNLQLKFSSRFADYNANVRKQGNNLEFRFSSSLKGVSEEIFMGLIQELMLKIFNEKRIKTTMYINLYNSFVKNLHVAVPKNKSHPILLDSYHRINEKYFDGAIERPNLVWGGESKSTLGTYDYKADTITVSKIFYEHIDVLDFIMYHEMLHKKYKFKNSGSRTYHHTKEFKKEEHAFENFKDINQRMSAIIKDKKKSSSSRRKRSILPLFGIFQ